MTPEEFPEVVPRPPVGITAAGLVALGNEWVDTTGGEFKGDKNCGCEHAEYAIRISAATQINNGII